MNSSRTGPMFGVPVAGVYRQHEGPEPRDLRR